MAWRTGGRSHHVPASAAAARPASFVDLAVATFYLRRGPDDRERALRAGYREVRRLPEGPADALNALLADRQLLLANSLLTAATPSMRALRAEYLATSLADFGTG